MAVSFDHQHTISPSTAVPADVLDKGATTDGHGRRWVCTHRYIQAYSRDHQTMPFSQQASARLPFVTCTLARRKWMRLAFGGAQRKKKSERWGTSFDHPALTSNLKWNPVSTGIPCFLASKTSSASHRRPMNHGNDLWKLWKMPSLKLQN